MLQEENNTRNIRQLLQELFNKESIQLMKSPASSLWADEEKIPNSGIPLFQGPIV
jgi:hypothetical protein